VSAPLLLHSMAEFAELIESVLRVAGAQRVVEIGGEGGQLTERLAGLGVEVTCVDPDPSPHLRALAGDGRVRLVEAKSPGTLDELERFDVYVMDGDHNFHVVSAELEAIFAAGETPVALLHDVAWPSARRDMYYDPDDVPPEARQPLTFEGGAVPGEIELQVGRGFQGVGSFAMAVREGGERNGVLTAVEAFLEGRPELEFQRVPCVFGLGVIFAREAPYADELRRLLEPFHESVLLARLEANRLELYLEVLDRRRAAEGLGRAQRELLDGLERELEAERAENARLRLALAERSDA
jgi:hypothetical protein